MLNRIQALEKEVLDLRTEVKLLKQHAKIESLEPTKEIRISVPASPIKTKQDNEAIIPKQTKHQSSKRPDQVSVLQPDSASIRS